MTLAEQSEIVLAKYLGPHTAKTAVKTFCLRALGGAGDAMTPENLPKFIDGILPTLKALLGNDSAERVVRELAEAKPQ